MLKGFYTFVLTEKPNVAKDIAEALGGFKSVSYSERNSYFTRNGDVIVPACGHLLTLFEPQDYNPSWATWSLKDLPIIPQTYRYKPIESVSKVLEKIKYCFDNFDSTDFVLATDAEREGEYIGALILDYVGFKNYSSAKRFWVSEALTSEVVKKGFKNLKPLSAFQSYKNAGYARAKSDWLLGINVSRLLAKSTNTNAFFGRVQTAILAAIYNREKRIKDFIPTPYYQLKAKCFYNNSYIDFIYIKNDTDRFENKIELETVTGYLKPWLTVTDISTERKTENQPQLFNITGLQKYCSTKYHITPEDTLNCAQNLYEKHKCLSYPRTPSTILGDDNVDLFFEKFDKLSKAYPQLAQGCGNKYITSDNKRLFNSAKLQDHHALIPLAPLPDSVSSIEKQVYEAVLIRFFQTIKEPHVYEITTIKGTSADETFIAKGKKILQQGWKENQDTDEEENPAQTIPDGITKGTVMDFHETKIIECETKPKKHYTNATLLALMENPKGEDENLGKLTGIGTPATRAGIIATLLKREYITQKGQNLLITEKGIFIIKTVSQIPFLADMIKISTTTEWEKQLALNPENFLDANTNLLKNEISKAEIKSQWEATSIGPCPICHKGKFLEGKKAFYCSEYKSGCKAVIWKDNFCGAKINVSDAQALLAGKRTRLKKMFSKKTNREFSAQLSAFIENGELKLLPVFEK